MLNINVGILGHVDSGKTSLAKALSTVSSTAAFDKSPQSHERGITLDLGFSSFSIDVSKQERYQRLGIHTLQVTLVDCPGHASLIRTVIGGAQIVDMMLLVVDVTKGIQTQTAECLVVGEMIAKPLVMVLNKIDAIQGVTNEDQMGFLRKMRRRLEATMAQTRWPTAPIVNVAADPGAAGLRPLDPTVVAPPIGTGELISKIVDLVDAESLKKERDEATALASTGPAKNFRMFVDHCFPVKGQGTVLTGTVMDGVVRVGDEVFMPEFQQTRRVKGIQVFRKAVLSAVRGDRIGVCITQFDSGSMERGVVCSAGAPVVTTHTVVAIVRKVRYHKQPIEAGEKFHISVGHATVMGTMRFFAAPEACDSFDVSKEYLHIDGLPDDSCQSFEDLSPDAPRGYPASAKPRLTTYFAVVLLERPVTTTIGSTMIASHLDSDIHSNVCRLAVEGVVVCTKGFDGDSWRQIQAVRYKHKRLLIDRVVDAKTCIVKGLVRARENLDAKAAGAMMFSEVQRFIGLQVHATQGKLDDCEASPPPSNSVAGTIEAPFGKTGKVRVAFKVPIFQEPPSASERRSKRPPPKKKHQDPTVTDEKGEAAVADAAEEKDEPESMDSAVEAEGQATVATPRVALYFFTKKYPFAQHNPMAQ